MNIWYCEDEGEFYKVKKTAKTLTINWISKISCDGRELDFNVKWKQIMPFKISLTKNRRHCLRECEDDYLLIYPNQAGQPFSLTPATIKDLEKETAICHKWGTSTTYYDNLAKLL